MMVTCRLARLLALEAWKRDLEGINTDRRWRDEWCEITVDMIEQLIKGLKEGKTVSYQVRHQYLFCSIWNFSGGAGAHNIEKKIETAMMSGIGLGKEDEGCVVS